MAEFSPFHRPNVHAKFTVSPSQNIYLNTYIKGWPDKRTISDLAQISIVCDPVGLFNFGNGFKLNLKPINHNWSLARHYDY